MPLAIELAAAQLDAIDIDDLDAALAQQVTPVSNARDSTVRQESMDAGVAWSYGLLDEDGRRVFRCLAAFPHGGMLSA